MIFPNLLIFCTISLLPACASNRVNPLLSQEPDVKISATELAQKQRKLDQLWNQRHQFDSVSQFIDLAETVSKTYQRDFKTMLRLTRAYHLRGEYLQRDSGARLADWEMGMNWAEKALTLNPEYRGQVINLKRPPEASMESLTVAEVEALYWYAVNLGKSSALQGPGSISKNRARVKKIIDYIAKVAPDMNYGAIYRYYGAYFALQPGYDRSDLNYSRESFEAAIKKFPDYFTNRTLYAQVYAVKMKDTDLYKQQLRWVVKARPDSVPDFYSEQLLEQRRAGELLKEEK